MTRQQQAQRNRERYPDIARLVDEFRAVFGPGVKVMEVRDANYVSG